MTDYTFGYFELFGLFILLLLMSGLVANTAIIVVTQHNGDAANFEQTIRYAHWLVLVTSATVLLGRPVLTSIPDAYKTVKETVA